MKLLCIGSLLLIYGCFFSPAFIEPWDIIISTGYIAIANQTGVPTWAIILWIISGYIALILGLLLIGHTIVRIPHPMVFAGVAIIIGVILYYYFFVINNLVII